MSFSVGLKRLRKRGDSMKGPWMQELMWVQRNEHGIWIGVSDTPPIKGDMVPTLPRLVKQSTDADPQPADGVGCNEDYFLKEA
jgi:hypothetical protein